MKYLPRNAISTQSFKLVGVARIPLRVTIEKQMRVGVVIKLSYIPHKLLLLHDSIDAWLQNYKVIDMPLENLVVQLMDDINNEVIPYWVSIEIETENGLSIFAEDCQPTWRGKTQIVPNALQRNFNRFSR